MPEPVFLITIGSILGLGAIATFLVIFWHQILDWCQNSVFPWIKANIPWIESQVREAFNAVDKVIVPIRNGIRQAWKNLRDYLLKQVQELERESSGKWILRTTSWIIKVLKSDKKVPVKVETEEEVDWEELPPDIRAEFLRHDKSYAEINVTEIRDKELE